MIVQLTEKLTCRVAFTLLLAASAASSPAQLLVNTLSDGGAGSLRDQIDSAVGGETLAFAPAIWGGTILLSSEISIDVDLSIDGPGPQNMTLSGGGTTRIFLISGAATSVSVRGLRFENGFSSEAGGAIRNNSADLFELTNLVFEENSTACAIVDCDASGGAVKNSSGTTISVIGCAFRDNASHCEGAECDASGAAFDNTSGGAVVLFLRNSFERNDSSCLGFDCDASGAGIDNGGGSHSSFLIDRSSFVDNSSTCEGNECTASGAALDNGGGAFSIDIENSTFYGNTVFCDGDDCDADGGALAPGVETRISFTTFSANGTSCLGIDCTARGQSLEVNVAEISNSLWDSLVPAETCSGGGITSLGYNIDTDSSCVDGTTMGDQVQTSLGLDPTGPQQNGGTTPTVRLLPQSAAIDSADPAVCPPSPTTDQRGELRPEGMACDIGAFEGAGGSVLQIPISTSLTRTLLALLLACAGVLWLRRGGLG